ncbi:hypothetical protein V5O48_001071 [Marasmius crinis-equi]|uniref:Uncharacterized protein n=1 Tax=Marasmius crinis-equi TaxID=585013 RepID=A0ABR3FZM8_9AGAR
MAELTGSRPYLRSELEVLTNPQLAQLVLREKRKWPHTPHTDAAIKRAKKDKLIEALLSSENDFRTTDPPPPPPPPPPLLSPCSQASFPTIPPTGTTALPAIEGPTPFNVSNTANMSAFLVNPPASIPVPPPPERRKLNLFVMDHRQTSPNYQPQSAEIVVEVFPDPDEPGEYRIDAKQLVRLLQKTNAKVEGRNPVSILHQDQRLTLYSVTFAEEVVPDDCDTYEFNPRTLHFPDTRSMFLFINVPKRLMGQTDEVKSAVTSDKAKEPEEPAPTDSKSPARNKDTRRPEVVGYLCTKMSEREGLHERVEKHRGNTKLQNPEIVEDWRHVSEFYSAVVDKRFPGPGPSAGRKITKGDVVAAFGYSSSWIDDVRAGYELVRIYGREGDKPSEDVIHELEAYRPNSPKGRTALLNFLKKHHKGTDGSSS